MDRVIANEAKARGEDEEAVRQSYVTGVSMKTWVQPEDIANSVHFLASDAGGKISGQILAVDGHTETLAMELGPFGVRVNAVCPGAVEGPRMDRVIAREAKARGEDEEAVRQSYVTGVSMKSWVQPEDIANSVHFLASDAGGKISGQILAVDGHTETLA